MLTDQRVEAIFQEMDELVIELASDPSSLGPQYFQDLIATCRNYLNRVGLVLNELNRERLIVSSELRRQEAAYELEYDDILANDQSIKDLGSSIEDRKAAVGWRLREQRIVLNEVKSRLQNLNAVHKVVSFRNKELHATMTAIRDQKRLMASEIRSGSFYGDERPTSIKPGEDDGGGLTAEELAMLMSGDSNQPEPVVTQESSPRESQAVVLSVEGDEGDVLRFLNDEDCSPRRDNDSNSAAAPSAEATDTGDDFEDLLENV